MKLLLDECIDWRLSRDLSTHEIKTTRQMGWTGISNGELLTLAEQQFDVFITVDRNLSYQQNLAGSRIAVIVLRATTNRLTDLRRLAPQRLRILDEGLSPGTVRIVGGS